MIKNLDLAGSKLVGRDRPGVWRLPIDPSQRQAARGQECSSGSDEANDFPSQLKRCAGRRNVTPCTVLKCIKYRVRTVDRREDDDRRDFQQLLERCESLILIVVICRALTGMIKNKVKISRAL